MSRVLARCITHLPQFPVQIFIEIFSHSLFGKWPFAMPARYWDESRLASVSERAFHRRRSAAEFTGKKR